MYKIYGRYLNKLKSETINTMTQMLIYYSVCWDSYLTALWESYCHTLEIILLSKIVLCIFWLL